MWEERVFCWDVKRSELGGRSLDGPSSFRARKSFPEESVLFCSVLSVVILSSSSQEGTVSVVASSK